MPDTLPNTPLPANEWVDLYDATGIAVGVPIEVDNVGDSAVRLTVRPDAPPLPYDSYNILPPRSSHRLRNSAGDTGAWALCRSAPGVVNIRALA